MSAVAFEYYSYDDYCMWEGDWELVDGIAYAMAPSPVFNHQFLLSEILYSLKEKLQECQKCFVLAEEDYKVDEHTVVRPDVVVVCERFKTHIDKAPKLIVEVVSKSSSKRDEKIKFDIYQKEGVKYYILAYHESKRVKVYENKDGYIQLLSKDDVYNLEIDGCEFIVDFKRVFRRL